MDKTGNPREDTAGSWRAAGQGEGIMGDLQIVTTADRHDLDEQATAAFRPGWPEFIFHDQISSEHIGRVETHFPHYDVLLLDDGQVVAGGWESQSRPATTSCPMRWPSSTSTGSKTAGHTTKPTCGCATSNDGTSGGQQHHVRRWNGTQTMSAGVVNPLPATTRIADDGGHDHEPASRHVYRGRQAV